MRSLWRDLRYGARTLGKSPGFTLAAVVVLALGLGASMSIFNLFDAVLLRPPPGIAQPDRLVLVGRTLGGQGFEDLSWPNYLDCERRNQVFSGVAAFSHEIFHLSAAGETIRAPGALVSASYFQVLGVRPALGRLFLPAEEDVRGGAAVAVISRRLWARLYGNNPAAIGGQAVVNGRSLTIVGVAAVGFRGTDIRQPAADIWVPIGSPAQVRPSPVQAGDRGWSWLSMIARLEPGVSPGQAAANVGAIAAQLERDYPGANRAAGLVVAPYHALGGGDARRDTSRMLFMLMAMTLVVLLVACANVASLLVARASARAHEVAIRMAVGAGSGHLVRQFLAEGLVLSLIACTAGMLVSVWTTDLLPGLFPSASGLPPALDLGLRAPLIAYALGLALLCCLVFSLVPAMRASRLDLASTLRIGDATTTRGSSRLRGVLAAVQVALCVVVLAAAGLFARSLQALRSIDPRMRTEGVLLASLDPGLNGYDEAAARRLYRQLLERAGALPGVESATIARVAPFGNSGLSFGPVLGGSVTQGAGVPTDCNLAGPDYFRTLGIALLRGRDFGFSDHKGSPRVAIVNQTLARRLWPSEDPLGKPIRFSGQTEQWTVVGVARDSLYRNATESARPFLYLPALQFSSPAFSSRLPDFTLHLRARGAPLDLVDSLRQLVRESDPNLPLYDVRTLRAQWERSFWPWRMAATLAGTFGLLAVAMATVGLYAVVAYRVSRRKSEIGLRMALGARPGEIVMSAVREGMQVTAVGLAAGVALALAGTRLLGSFLYGVTTTDPATYAVVSLLLLATALVACWIPARRATRIDPITALRSE